MKITGIRVEHVQHGSADLAAICCQLQLSVYRNSDSEKWIAERDGLTSYGDTVRQAICQFIVDAGLIVNNPKRIRHDS